LKRALCPTLPTSLRNLNLIGTKIRVNEFDVLGSRSCCNKRQEIKSVEMW